MLDTTNLEKFCNFQNQESICVISLVAIWSCFSGLWLTFSLDFLQSEHNLNTKLRIVFSE